MDLSIYFHNECIAICMLLLIILFVLEAGNRRGSEWKRYIPALYIVALLFLTIDATVFIIDGDANLIVFHKVIRSIYLIGLPVFGWLWLRYCAVRLKNLRFLHAPVMKALLALILTANAAFVILSWQSGDVCSVMDKGVHVPGTWIWLPTMLMYGQMFFAAICSLIGAYQAKTVTERHTLLMQALHIVPLFVTGFVRLLLPSDMIVVHFGFVVTALLALFVAGFISNRVKGKPMFVFGYSWIWVETGSMENTIPARSYILIKAPDDAAHLEKGTVITFTCNDKSSEVYGQYVTHRIDEVVADGYKTKGDNVISVQDKWTVHPEDVLSVYVGNLPVLTFMGRLLMSEIGFVVIVMAFLFICAFIYIPDIIKAAKEGKEEPAAEALSQEELERRIAEEVERLKKQNDLSAPPESPDGRDG